jgi:hypothetical protein
MNPELKSQVREALAQVIALPGCNPHVLELATNYLVTGGFVRVSYAQVSRAASVFEQAFWLMLWVHLGREELVRGYLTELNRLTEHYEP